MSIALIELGFEKPKQRFRLSPKDMVITVIWSGMALLIGMGVVYSMQAANPSVAQSSNIQGL